MGCEKDFVVLLSALLTPVIAISAVSIALMQWKVNSKRLKNEHFERRFPQYQCIQTFLGSIMQEGRPTIEAQREYLAGTAGIEFTYSKEVKDYLDSKVWNTAIDLETTESEQKGMPVGQERTKLIQEARNLKNMLYKERSNIYDLLRPYLDLDN